MLRFNTCHLKSLFFIFVLILAGCSSGGGNPVEPPSDNAPVVDVSVTIPENMEAGGTIPMLFGIYEVELDPSSLTGDVHPLRNSGVLGDSFSVDITPFLTITPCSDCLKIKSIAVNADDLVEVTFVTKHPFAPLNRYDLHVFDMRGIVVMGEGVTEFQKVRLDLDGDHTYETIARGTVDLLVNADGYTSFYKTTVEKVVGKVFDSNICPFKNLWVNPATTSPDSNYNPTSAPQYGFTDLLNPTGQNVFPMGGNFSNPLAATIYQFDFTNHNKVNFMFILEASYGHTTIRATRKEPRFFLPEFHRKEPWFVGVQTISNDLIGGNSNSSATFALQVMDWQAGIAPTPAWNYKTSTLTSTKYASDIKQIVLDIPGILNNPLDFDLTDLTSGNGSFSDPYVWQFTIDNERAAVAGDYWGLIAVRDQLEGTTNGPLGVSGSSSIPVKINDVTTYQAFKVPVVYVNIPPVADVFAMPSPARVCSDVAISVGPNCMDPDGVIVRYEYDFEYDGTNFAADAIQNEGDPNFGQDVITQYSETQAGPHTIAQRVTDNGDLSVIGTFVITITANQAPVSEIQDDDTDDQATSCDTITFQPGVGVNDPDGVITKYEYDWDYNGSTFAPDVIQNSGDPNFGDPVTHQFSNTTESDILYTVALRVTDDGCPDLTNIDTVLFTIKAFFGQMLFENFESTSGGSLPTGWGLTGHTGDAYYVNTTGQGCTDTTWRWGVTANTSQCEGGENNFLNESGENHPNSDVNEAYQNRGQVVYTPEFTVPPAGAVVTVRHNYNFLYGVLGGSQYLDGGRVILSVDNPGTIDWDDFCNYAADTNGWNNRPLRPLARISGPSLSAVSAWAVSTHPLYPSNGLQAHVGSSAGWQTNTYSIPASYACQKVRLGFLFASDDLLLGYLSYPPAGMYTDCSQFLGPPYGPNLYPNFGWRINWMSVVAN